VRDLHADIISKINSVVTVGNTVPIGIKPGRGKAFPILVEMAIPHSAVGNVDVQVIRGWPKF